MTLFAKILIRRDTAGSLGGVVCDAGMPFYFTDTKEWGVGDGTLTCAELVSGRASYEEIEPASAGTASIDFAAATRSYAASVATAAGSGSYTRKIVLPQADRRAGDRAVFAVAMPASANPTITFHDDADTEPAMATVAPDTTARTVAVEFIFDGAAWLLTGAVDTVLGTALRTAATAAAARTALGLTADGQSLVTAANYAAMRALLEVSACIAQEYTTPASDVTMAGGVTLLYTLPANAGATTSARTVTLPAASSVAAGQRVLISDSGLNLDGVSGSFDVNHPSVGLMFVLSAPGGWAELMSDGVSEWLLIGGSPDVLESYIGPRSFDQPVAFLAGATAPNQGTTWGIIGDTVLVTKAAVAARAVLRQTLYIAPSGTFANNAALTLSPHISSGGDVHALPPDVTCIVSMVMNVAFTTTPVSASFSFLFYFYASASGANGSTISGSPFTAAATARLVNAGSNRYELRLTAPFDIPAAVLSDVATAQQMILLVQLKNTSGGSLTLASSAFQIGHYTAKRS